VLWIYRLNVQLQTKCRFKSTVSSSSGSGPYITQLGDPVLRRSCQHVPRENIKSTEVQEVIKQMVSMMQEHSGLVGLAAPQIGSSLQIIVVECREMSAEPSLREEMLFPQKIVINPKLTVTDPHVVVFKETCASVNYGVNVPRAYGVEITGLNENGDDVKWAVKGWPARILQHEVDHLNGILNIDRRQRMTPLYLIKKWIKWLKGE
ncbi:peptide deformylase, mitochondrial-like, partial [Amphiura filiformis]|uniref:peptide deformylase, mitochondrial-like n=1 Tax=Amphiura filiformis TaxID=82378 RepID=UPI003B210358